MVEGPEVLSGVFELIIVVDEVACKPLHCGMVGYLCFDGLAHSPAISEYQHQCPLHCPIGHTNA